ncbi:MAG: DUF3486 family protein [Xanthomonadaceae bacterium]|nr:DUF3486 family protein [Xanthomonadaceae bacterium]
MVRRIGSVDRTPEDMRKFIDGVLRANRMTVDELRQQLAKLYPEAEVPSRSALYRYKGSIAELTGRMHEMQVCAEAFVSDLGENPDDKVGALMVQSLTALTAHLSLKANDPDSETTVEDARKLARAARDLISARSMALKERQQIEDMARQKLLREQSERLDKVVKSGGLSEETAADLRRKILGIG